MTQLVTDDTRLLMQYWPLQVLNLGPFGYRMPSATSWQHLLTPSWLPGDGEVASDVHDQRGRDSAAGPAQRALPGGHFQ